LDEQEQNIDFFGRIREYNPYAYIAYHLSR